MIRVTNATYSSLAGTEDLTGFARRQFDNTVTTLTRSQLSKVTSGTNKESALTGTELDVVYYSTDGDVLQGQSITNLGSSLCTTHHSGTYCQTVGSNNITFFTISIVKKSNTS